MSLIEKAAQRLDQLTQASAEPEDELLVKPAATVPSSTPAAPAPATEAAGVQSSEVPKSHISRDAQIDLDTSLARDGDA